MPTATLLARFGLLAAISAVASLLTRFAWGLNVQQTISVTVFLVIILATLFMVALVFQVCDVLKVRPVPFLIITVMAPNVGSAGTMLGNPVGILIGSRAGLTFEDFMVWAFPVMLLSLAATGALLMVWYRREIAQLTERLEQRRGHALPLGPIVAVPYRRGLLLIVGTIGLVALHHRIEVLLDLETNTVRYLAPLISAGILMI